MEGSKGEWALLFQDMQSWLKGLIRALGEKRSQTFPPINEHLHLLILFAVRISLCSLWPVRRSSMYTKVAACPRLQVQSVNSKFEWSCRA